jgi:hypothetical protein
MSPDLHLEYAKMAQAYLRLAALADRNSHTDIVYESPAPSPGASRRGA